MWNVNYLDVKFVMCSLRWTIYVGRQVKIVAYTLVKKKINARLTDEKFILKPAGEKLGAKLDQYKY